MDLSMIGKLYTADGPFVSVYVDAASAVENAQYLYETKWRGVERDLAEQGVDATTIAAVVAARGEHSQGNTRVVIAAHGSVLLARSLPEKPAAEIVRVSALPHVTPLVDAAARVRPHVVALIDRTGADIFAYTESDTDIAEFAVVEGDAPDIRKLRGTGGWRMRHIQARAEEGWEHNAKEIAETLDRVCRDVGARLVVAAGDTREIELVRGDLPAERQAIFERVPGGRSEDGSAESVFRHVAEKLDDRRAKDVVAVLEQYEENRGRGTLAAEGLAHTVAALRGNQVDTLILAEDYAGAEPLWVGPEPVHIGTTRDDLSSMGVPDPQEADAIDAVLRAAVATNAEVVRAPAGVEQAPRGGVGALLRFDVEG